MPDREQVIKGLECLITNEVECNECPYNVKGGYCLKTIAEDALVLLKKQEPKGKNRLPYSPDSNVQWT